MRLKISKDHAKRAQRYIEACPWLSLLGLVRVALAVGITTGNRYQRPAGARMTKLPFTYETLDPGRVFAVTLAGEMPDLKTQKEVCGRIEELIEGGLEDIFHRFPEPDTASFSRFVNEIVAVRNQ